MAIQFPADPAPQGATSDPRVVYGATCTWWDSIAKAGLSGRIPACPECSGVLFEVPDEAAWWISVDRYDKDHPGYRKVMEWLRGKCFPTFHAATRAYDAAMRAAR